MKVYVLTSGEHSDYRVEGVFSSEDAARRFTEKFPKGEFDDWNDPIEHEVDEPLDHEMGPSWTVKINLESGEIKDPFPAHETRHRRHPSACEVHECWWMGSPPTPAGELSVRSPTSREHAVEVAVERRQEWLRARETKGATA
jgi:hypothetical protein